MSGRLRERMEERLPRRLEELSNLYGVSGDEGRVRRYLKDRLAGLEGLTMKTDTMGSLIVHRRGDGPRVMVCAHMDEVGFLIRGALDNGLLFYDQKGIDPRVAVSKRVAVGKAELPGVIGAKAIHLQTREELKKALPHEELFIDIGARNKEEALELVKPGESACFTTKFGRLGENIVKGKALDDRVGCAVLLELLENTYECDFYGVFTVQEELGLRGAQAAVYTVAPQVALVLEATTANDLPKASERQQVTCLGGGAAITFMDGVTIALPRMYKALVAAAVEEGIPWQPRRGCSGGTDGGAIHKALGGCVTGGISVACRYIHSPCGVASLEDIFSAYRLADAFLRKKKFMEVL